MKVLIAALFFVSLSFSLSSCGGGKSDAELGAEAAGYYMQMIDAEKAGDSDKQSEMLKKMNEIRKPYVVGDKAGTPAAEAFNAAMKAAKEAKGYE